MNTKMTLLLICGLCCFFACKNENSNKSATTNTEESVDSDGNKALEGLIKTNLNAKDNIKQALSKGNDGETIAKWFPETLLDFRLDKSKKDIGEDEESRAKATYVHLNDVNKTISINVWDGNGPLAVFVNNMIATRLDGRGKEENSELRKNVYLRNGRKSSERIILQSNQVDISFEIDGRFFVTARGSNNTIEAVWEALDLLNFDALK